MTKIRKEENQNIKEIKNQLNKEVKYADGDIYIRVMVYDSFEDEQTYDVEINLYIDGEYEDGWVNHIFYGNHEGDELAEKEAVKRAKVVLRTVKSWFEYNDDIEIDNTIEVYHA